MRKLIYTFLVVLVSACGDNMEERFQDSATRNDTTVTEKKDSVDGWEVAVDTTFTITGTETN